MLVVHKHGSLHIALLLTLLFLTVRCNREFKDTGGSSCLKRCQFNTCEEVVERDYHFEEQDSCCAFEGEKKRCISSNSKKYLEPSSLSLNFEYTHGKDKNIIPSFQFDIVARWRYQGKYADEFSNKYQGNVWVEMEYNPDGKKICRCIPSNVTTFRLKVPQSLTQGPCEHSVKRTAKFKVMLSDKQENVTALVKDCWTATRNNSYATCGPQIPSAPTNVSSIAELSPDQTSYNLAVSWGPPLFNNTPVVKYMIEIWDTWTFFWDTVCCDVFKKSYSGLKFKTKNLTIIVKPLIRVTEETVSYQQYQFCIIRNETLVEGKYELNKIQWIERPLSEEFNTNYIIWPSFAGTVVLISIVLTLTCIIWRLHKKKKRYERLQEISCSSVFLVSSTNETDNTSRKIRSICHELGNVGILPVYHEYEWTSHGPDSPGALGINRWVEKQFIDCSFVLFVCTQTFAEEWNTGSNATVPIVWTARHFLDGILPNEVNISRFVVLLIGEPCEIPIDLQRMQTLPLFQDGTDTCDIESLERYLKNSPEYNSP